MKRPLRERMLRAGRLRRVPAPAAAAAGARASPRSRRRARSSRCKTLAPPWREASRRRARRLRRRAQLGRVGLLTGCVQSVLLRRGESRLRARALGLWLRGRRRRTAAAAARSHSTPAGARGPRARAPHRERRSRRPGVEAIVTNAAGCGSHLKEAGLDIPVLDISEALVAGRAPQLHPLELRVAFQDSCHLGPRPARSARSRASCSARSRASSCSSPPSRRSAAAAPASTTWCSRRPLASSATARPHMCSPLARTSTSTANPGCLLQVSAALRRAGRPLPAAHPVELLDASLHGAPAASKRLAL